MKRGTASRHTISTGQLKAFHTCSTLPEGFDGSQNTCADIEITRDGRHVHASNRGHNSIAGFSVDTKTDKLTSIGQFSTGNTPRSFNLDSDNHWMVAAGQRSHNLHVYKRDDTNSSLKRIHQQPTSQGLSGHNSSLETLSSTYTRLDKRGGYSLRRAL